MTLEYISAEARARRWKSGRCGEGRRGMEGAESDTGIDGPRYAGLDICDAQMGE